MRNLYGFVDSNPLIRLDPRGLQLVPEPLIDEGEELIGWLVDEATELAPTVEEEAVKVNEAIEVRLGGSLSVPAVPSPLVSAESAEGVPGGSVCQGNVPAACAVDKPTDEEDKKKKNSCYCMCISPNPQKPDENTGPNPIGRMSPADCKKYPYTHPEYSHCYCK